MAFQVNHNIMMSYLSLSGISEDCPIFVDSSSDGCDSQLILENDDFHFSSIPIKTGMEYEGLCFQQPYEVDVGKGSSLPQMDSKKGDVDQLPPYEYQYFGNGELPKDDGDMFVPYYDYQMRALKIGAKSYVL